MKTRSRDMPSAEPKSHHPTDEMTNARVILIENLQKELSKLGAGSFGEVAAASYEESDLLQLTLNFFQSSASSFVVVPKTVGEAKMVALSSSLGRCIGHLEQMANQGDPIAVKHYVHFVRERVEKLNILASKHREIVLPLSRGCLSWPAQISRMKVFGDDIKGLIKNLEIGEHTIAGDPRARFNPQRKFGRIALQLIRRIEHSRRNVRSIDTLGVAPKWLTAAEMLPAFSNNLNLQQKNAWITVARLVLEDDIQSEEQAESYRSLITAKSHQTRWKGVFINKILGEFDSLWRIHRRARS